MANADGEPSRVEIDAILGAVLAIPFDLAPGLEIPPHRHRRSQLVFAKRGVMTVTTVEGSWVLPAQRALWVPAGVEHGIRTTGEVHLRAIYLEPEAAPFEITDCVVVAVSGLLRELILRAVSLGPTVVGADGDAVSKPLADLLLEELDRARRTPLRMLYLPEGRDPRVRRLMRRLREDPGDRGTLKEWGRRIGASERTLARLFMGETGLAFSQWRRQLRLQRSLELLASDQNVTEIAAQVGYESLSAFITMFRRATGQTPTAYRQATGG